MLVGNRSSSPWVLRVVQVYPLSKSCKLQRQSIISLEPFNARLQTGKIMLI